MKILITGANGQLGSELVRVLRSGISELGAIPEKLARATVIPTDIENLNITNRHEVAAFVRQHAPDVIISCAAYTNVDGCELNADDAFKVNALGARNLAMAAQETGAKLVHVSTDYVFSGNEMQPINECALPAPQSVYGKTKLLGEEYVKQLCSHYFIVRTTWLYGYQGANFVKTMLRVAKEKGEVTVVNDQIGSPTSAADLAFTILKLITTKEYGVYHCTNTGICSWYDFACEIIRLAGINVAVKPCSTEAYLKSALKAVAPRPAYSKLDCMMLRTALGFETREWHEALECFFKNYKLEDNI